MNEETKYKEILRCAGNVAYDKPGHKELAHEFIFRCYVRGQEVLGDDFNLGWITVRLRWLERDLAVARQTYRKYINNYIEMKRKEYVEFSPNGILVHEYARKHIAAKVRKGDSLEYLTILEFWLEGYNGAEIASVLGKRPDKVQDKLKRIIEWLKELKDGKNDGNL